ncbi:hypothetical protein [Streptomyces sp. CC0208]|uniref:Uncharacterized protein n=1 Tax=Streptomyces sviceus (strain ATCC 29083 / DSM 924 / JCM 4929 / NBRC 13980 / NCIMB 11184 / NRRL 5439 / UC 5370) TaxID=463191 RepID=B5HUP5_STRX2|nr:hypothetical protein [Streptomyces sp. CC0208]EDY56551.1 conserved hypothetical protein [Streptomyces sviceus ATCC 29083]
MSAAPSNPVLAALLHNTSSIAVAADSARLVRHTPHLPRDAAHGCGPHRWRSGA